MFPHTFLGSRCPSCKVTNWKYQSYVIPLAILVGTAGLAGAFIFVLSSFWARPPRNDSPIVAAKRLLGLVNMHKLNEGKSSTKNALIAA